MNGKKKDRQAGSPEGRILLRIIQGLLVLCICLGFYQIAGRDAGEQPSGTASEDGVRLVRSAVIGDTPAELETQGEGEDAVYVIAAALPADFPFERTTLYLELEDGARISDESNCILTDLGGRWVVNLTVENAAVVVSDGEHWQEYRFRLELT
ncbi:MAG: hypothetical protein Q4C82_08585 [Eubacteriales bacterium]|nr:hypothetical protein [Eubacteriales bacterium]